MTAQRVSNDFNVVREPGLEPGRVTPPEPKPGHPNMKPLETRAIRGHAMPKTGTFGPYWDQTGPDRDHWRMR